MNFFYSDYYLVWKWFFLSKEVVPMDVNDIDSCQHGKILFTTLAIFKVGNCQNLESKSTLVLVFKALKFKLM